MIEFDRLSILNRVSWVLVDPLLECIAVSKPEICVAVCVVVDGNRHCIFSDRSYRGQLGEGTEGPRGRGQGGPTSRGRRHWPVTRGWQGGTRVLMGLVEPQLMQSQVRFKEGS
jgi:hypothetical protein